MYVCVPVKRFISYIFVYYHHYCVYMCVFWYLFAIHFDAQKHKRSMFTWKQTKKDTQKHTYIFISKEKNIQKHTFTFWLLINIHVCMWCFSFCLHTLFHCFFLRKIRQNKTKLALYMYMIKCVFFSFLFCLHFCTSFVRFCWFVYLLPFNFDYWSTKWFSDTIKIPQGLLVANTSLILSIKTMKIHI